MNTRFSQLRCKEIINIKDGSRLGYLSDIIVDTSCGKVEAIIIPGPAKFFGLFGRGEEYCVLWDCICQIGEDIIIIDAQLSEMRTQKQRKNLL